MKIVCLIPARYESTRFEGKMMQQLGSKKVILHTHDNVRDTNLFSEVYVVTDSPIIYNEIVNNNGKAIMSLEKHSSGSDRIAEAAQSMDVDIIVNVQGDYPDVDGLCRSLLESMIEQFIDDDTGQVQVVSAMRELRMKEHIIDPNYVKVVVDKKMNALYFSRSVIPHVFNQNTKAPFYEHLGFYAFRKEALLYFYKSSATELELLEKVECLRYLENGIPIRMVTTDYQGIEIDTPEDLERAIKLERFNK
jgi:3-deoxy-manno-octulosonate cytidylyltransferase (CMP-KDO synthetase)